MYHYATFDSWRYSGQQESQGIKMDDVEQLIKATLIPTFSEQSKRSQFAALVLCSEEDREDSFREVEFFPTDGSEPLLDNTKVRMPEYRFQYGNYLAARPTDRGRIHAEQLLLDEYDYLLSSYRDELGCIILYTRITPCSTCAEAIVNKFPRSCFDEVPKVVAYTTNTEKKGGDDVEAARQTLKNAGFTVLKVPYFERNFRRR